MSSYFAFQVIPHRSAGLYRTASGTWVGAASAHGYLITLMPWGLRPASMVAMPTTQDNAATVYPAVRVGRDQHPAPEATTSDPSTLLSNPPHKHVAHGDLQPGGIP